MVLEGTGVQKGSIISNTVVFLLREDRRRRKVVAAAAAAAFARTTAAISVSFDRLFHDGDRGFLALLLDACEQDSNLHSLVLYYC